MRPSDEQIRSAVREGGGNRPAARLLRERGYDISEGTIRRRLGSAPFELDVPQNVKKILFEDLLERRARQFERKSAVHQAEKVIPIRVNVDGPIGVGFFGDPHLDDDGTDVAEAFRHVDLFDGRQEGLFAACLGDVWNNWQGRLARLWSQQSTSAEEAKVLVENFLQRANWLFYIHGNHDAWGGGSDLLHEILKGHTAVEKNWQASVELRFPNGRTVKIFATHGFQGRSMWSPVFGASKKAQLDGHHDIYVGGHTHVSGYTVGWHEGAEKMWHAVQVASYKTIDRYATENGFPNRHIFNCPVAIIDPDADRPMNLIRWEFDPDEGAERLRWMRQGN